MQLLPERVSWAIKVIKDDKRIGEGISDIDLSQRLDVSEGTLNTYKKGGGVLKASTVEGLKKYYKFSVVWLYEGQGEPFPGAIDMGYKDVCGQEDHVMVRDTMSNYGPGTGQGRALKINIDEAWGKAYKVLSAGTTLSVALHMNIQQFAAALDTGQELKVCQDQIKNMQSQINELKGKVDRLTAVPIIAADPATGSEKKAM